MNAPRQQLRDLRLVGLVSALFLAAFACVFTYWQRRSREDREAAERARLTRVLNNVRSNLESELYARIYRTRAVAAYVSLHPEIGVEEFHNLAAEMIGDDPVVNTMSLAKGGTIGAVYPTEGHEAAIGLDLFAHAERREIVNRTIRTGRTFLAGPVELVEGGVAFISYTPVFDKTGPGEPTFWGVTDIVIRKPELLAVAGLEERLAGARFALRGRDGEGGNGDVFFGDPAIFGCGPVSLAVRLPHGEWILGAVPEGGWGGGLGVEPAVFWALAASGLAISVLAGLCVAAILRIRRDARQMRSIFGAMSGVVIELDRGGRVRWIAPTRQDMPGSRELIGRDLPLGSMLRPASADALEGAIGRCLAGGGAESLELELNEAGAGRWWVATLSAKPGGGVIAVMQSIGELKEQQARLEASERELRKLNADKDLLFSVIAHDLRAPAANIVGLSESLLCDAGGGLSDSGREVLELIHQSGEENLLLLENLLAWARSQQDGLDLRLERIPMKSVVDGVLAGFRELASRKQVELLADFDETDVIEFDRGMLETVLRNLISNAVKFNEPGGRVEIGLRRSDEADDTVELFVRDDGVGMAPEVAERLECGQGGPSVYGTAREKGAGLGMRLCHEFLVRHGARLRVESEPGRGTTVRCALCDRRKRRAPACCA